MRAVGPYSRPEAWANLDQRSSAARFLKRVRADLTAHVGGKPSAVQVAQIERCAMLMLHLAQIDAKALRGKEMTDHDRAQYLSWHGSAMRSLRELGAQPAETACETIEDIVARHRAARSAAA